MSDAAKTYVILLRAIGPATHKRMGMAQLPEAARERPSQTGVYFFSDTSPDFAWLEGYGGREDVHAVEKHLVVDFTRDVAKAGELVRLIDKNCVASTSRSWSSVSKIAAAARPHDNTPT